MIAGRKGRVGLRWVVAVAALGSVGSVTATAADTARWQEYQVRFQYASFNTYYNCASFADKLAHTLIKLGARPDVSVTTTGCSLPNYVGNMLNSRIKVSLPVLDPAGADSFTVTRRSVRLQTNEWATSGSGDCELIEQLARDLLPALKLTVTQNEVRCVPGQAGRVNQTLSVMALLPADRVTAGAPK